MATTTYDGGYPSPSTGGIYVYSNMMTAGPSLEGRQRCLPPSQGLIFYLFWQPTCMKGAQMMIYPVVWALGMSILLWVLWFIKDSFFINPGLSQYFHWLIDWFITMTAGNLSKYRSILFTKCDVTSEQLGAAFQKLADVFRSYSRAK